MSSREMGISPLFAIPTGQAKPFRPHSAPSTSVPSMADANPGASTTVHQRFDEAPAMFATEDLQFDGFFNPAMLSSDFLYPAIAPTSHLSQEQNANMYAFLSCYPQLGITQYNHSDCPRSVPNNTVDSLEEPQSHPPSAYHLDPQVSQHPIHFSAQSIPHPLQGLVSGTPQHRGLVDSIEMYGQDDQDTLASALTDHQEFHRSPSTPFSGCSEIESPCEDYNPDRDEPYAQRIFRCLKEAPNHTMVLKDIYKWFKENTDKGKDPNIKGWQNSIRHNLSMNKAFVKVELPPEKDQKKRYIWQLSKQALKEGVQSTTRFRSKHPNKRGHKSSQPLASRVASGQKGGEATRKSAFLRRSDRILEASRTPERARNSVPISCGPQHRYSSVPSPVPTSSLTDASECVSTSAPRSFSSSLEIPSSFQTPNGKECALGHLGLQYGGLASGTSTQIPTFSDSTYLPELPSQTEVHFLPLDGPLFCDTPESSSEPHTPSTYSDMNADQQPFFGGSSDGMMF